MSRGEGKKLKQTGLECQSDLPTHVAAIAVCRGLCKGYMLAMSALTNFAESLGLLDWIRTSCDDISRLSWKKKKLCQRELDFRRKITQQTFGLPKKNKHIFEDWLFEIPLF